MTPNAKIMMNTVKNGRSTGLIAIVAVSTSVAAQLRAIWVVLPANFSGCPVSAADTVCEC